VMAHASDSTTFYAMGVVLGLGWGVAMPVLSGLTFDVSQPRFRALNTNLAMEMFQCGFFIGPLAGGFILVHSSYTTLYYACAGLLFAGLAAGPALCGKRRKGLDSETL
jgi:MFS family permease